VLQHPDFRSGSIDTYFIDENPDLFKYEPSRNRAQKLLHYLADVKVNGPKTTGVTGLMPTNIQPIVPETPEGLCRWFLSVLGTVLYILYIP